MQRVGVAKGIGLDEHVLGIVPGLVHRVGRHDEGCLGRFAVLEQQPGALGVDTHRLVVVTSWSHVGGEVEHVVEVGGQIAEVARAEIAHARRDAEGVDLLLRARFAESGDSPDVVGSGEVLDEWKGDLPGRTGDQDLGVRERHAAELTANLTGRQNCGSDGCSGEHPAVQISQAMA